MQLRVGLSVVALGVGALVAGCGGDDEGAETTTAKAIEEIAEVRSGLEAALATYLAGDVTKADEQVGDAYLEHYELVEGPLEKVDHELSEQIEDSIGEELREKVKANAPAEEVMTLVGEIQANLVKAEAALK